MGKTHSKAKVLEDAVLKTLVDDSYIPKKTIKVFYATFMKRHPDGKMTETDFQRTFTKCVRSGNPDTFRTFAFCSRNEIGFKEFVLAVKMSSLGNDNKNRSTLKQTFIEVIVCMPENYYEIFCSGVQQLVERKILTEQWVIDLKEARQKGEGSVDCSIDVLGFLKKDIFDIVWNYLAGKISIETCFSTVFDKIGEASGFAGQHVGSMVGTLIAMKFNIGVEIAAIVGAVAGKISAQILTDFIKNWMSRLMNKDIENAYALFGTDASASDKKIESCYKKRARKYHPYKGGDIVKWIQLKHAKALIDDARGKKAKKSG